MFGMPNIWQIYLNGKSFIAKCPWFIIYALLVQKLCLCGLNQQITGKLKLENFKIRCTIFATVVYLWAQKYSKTFWCTMNYTLIVTHCNKVQNTSLVLVRIERFLSGSTLEASKSHWFVTSWRHLGQIKEPIAAYWSNEAVIWPLTLTFQNQLIIF